MHKNLETIPRDAKAARAVLGRHLRECREARCWSHASLAERMSRHTGDGRAPHRSLLSHVERGACPLSLQLFVALVKTGIFHNDAERVKELWQHTFKVTTKHVVRGFASRQIGLNELTNIIEFVESDMLSMSERPELVQRLRAVWEQLHDAD